MPSAPNRHEQRKAATRLKLLQAAREEIVEKGYDNVDILDITERANVSKATFYQHFPNKEECARQLMLQGYEALVSEILTDELDAPSRKEWVLRSYQKLFSWAEANRQFLQIMLGGAASHQLNIFGQHYMVSLVERLLVERGFDLPNSRYPAPVMAQIISGLLIQMLRWWLEADTGYTAQDMAQLVDDVLTNGIGSFA